MTETTNTKKCPFCAEDIKAEALKCKHCGETLDVVLRVAEEAKRSATTIVNTNMNASIAPIVAKRKFPHGWHLFGCLITALWWTPVYILHYIFRDKNIYE